MIYPDFGNIYSKSFEELGTSCCPFIFLTTKPKAHAQHQPNCIESADLGVAARDTDMDIKLKNAAVRYATHASGRYRQLRWFNVDRLVTPSNPCPIILRTRNLSD
jgi:hypothetical protein